MPLFADTTGTPMVDVARPGVLSILCLGRLPEDLRTVVATVFVRKLKADRMVASTVRRRLALSDEDVETQASLRQELKGHVPRTILAIDEAQILMPSRERSIARQALDSYVLEGRNFGLSLWLATQRPKGAISDRAVSQIDTFFVHRLSVADDIKAVCGMFQNRVPEKVRLRGTNLDVGDLIRSLEVGQAVLSSATSSAGTTRRRRNPAAHGRSRGRGLLMQRIPWTKFQDFYLRLGFLKVLVAVLDPHRRSISSEAVTQRLNSLLFRSIRDFPELQRRLRADYSWFAQLSERQDDAGAKHRVTVTDALLLIQDCGSQLPAVTASTAHKLLEWGRDVGFVGSAIRSRRVDCY